MNNANHFVISHLCRYIFMIFCYLVLSMFNSFLHFFKMSKRLSKKSLCFMICKNLGPPFRILISFSKSQRNGEHVLSFMLKVAALNFSRFTPVTLITNIPNPNQILHKKISSRLFYISAHFSKDQPHLRSPHGSIDCIFFADILILSRCTREWNKSRTVSTNKKC